ncbi:MAG: hypothetical protein J5858_08365 [Lentisphaeria bacterium]|nr:hypothetical protein [Lentisphaeria bacterium]
MNESIVFEKNFSFTLSPLEFISMTWVYINEIKPVLDRASKKETGLGINKKDLYFSFRTGILNGDLQKDKSLTPDKIRSFYEDAKCFFLLFENEKDNIDGFKPNQNQIQDARNHFADILHGKMKTFSSSLKAGKISFSFQLQRESNPCPPPP